MRRSVRGLVVVLVSTLAVIAGPAFADDDQLIGDGTGAGFRLGVTYQPTPEDRRANRALDQVVRAYARLRAGRTDPVSLHRLERGAEHVIGSRLPRLRDICVDGACPGPRQILDLRQVGQSRPWNCGAASGTMMARALGRLRSAANGRRLSQWQMGSPAHMRTNRYHTTPYDSGNFVRGLNRWLGGRETPYHQLNSPSARYTKKLLTYSVDHGRPLGLSTVEYAYGAHYNNHPRNQTIGHWVVARGYDGYGDRILVADSATTVWAPPHRYFSAPTGRFARAFLRTHGVAR